MLERYTESARRVLFFARYEVSQLGGAELGTEHVLLGLLRDPHGLVHRVLASLGISAEAVRKDVEERYRLLEPVFSTSVEIPFNADAQRALHFAAEEADRLLHNYVGNEHLLLGLLRAHGSVAESILAKHGLRLEDVRTAIREVLHESPRRSSAAIDGGLSGEIDSIKGMVRQLAGRSSDSEEAATLRELIVRSLDALKRHLAGGHEDDR